MMLTTTTALLLLATVPYVRAHASTDPESHCLWWQERTVTWVQNTAGNPATGATAFAAVSEGFHGWSAALATCSDRTLVEGTRSNSRRVGMETGGVPDANLVLFRYASCARKAPATAGCWLDGTCGNVYDCWDHTAGLLGVTTLSFSVSTGRILDADIELNAADNLFTTVGSPVCTSAPALSCVSTDVQNTVSHEVGHLLGLAHSPAPESTMNASSTAGDTSKRRVDTGSAAFLCEAYPRGLPAVDCVGGSTEPLTPGGCSAAPLGLGGLLGWALLGLRRRRAPAGAAALAALALAGAAQATTLLALDLESLTRASDVVARARVVRTQARWSADHARILTEVELEVAEAWKGAPGGRLTLTLPGGVVGDVGQRVEGAPRFAAGEEVVAFLEARGPGYTVTGLAQGAFRVERGPAGAAATQQSAGEARFVDLATRQEVAWQPLRLSLRELEARVRGAAASSY